jgi:hypothetical protein
MRLRSLPLLLLALAVAGCDSTDDALVLDADFYVGSWTLASVADDSGDRTAEIQTLLEDLAVDFESDRSFVLVADFPALVNAAGQPDVTQTGTYQAVAAAQTLSLLVSAGGSTLAPTFQAAASSEDRVTLTAPAVIVSQLLGNLDIDFEGDVVLGLARQ